MILGIGIDILHLPRLSSLSQRKSPTRLAFRILSASELTNWEKIPRTEEEKRMRFLAVRKETTRRWTVKEAVYKALYPTFKPTWKELSFLPSSEANRKPTLTFRAQDAKDIKLHVSVSHDGEYVVSQVLAEQGRVEG